MQFYKGDIKMSKNYNIGSSILKKRKNSNQCLICGKSTIPSHGITLELRQTKLGKICSRHNYKEEINENFRT